MYDFQPHYGFTTEQRMNLLDLGAAITALIKERKDKATAAARHNGTMVMDMMQVGGSRYRYSRVLVCVVCRCGP